MNTKDWIKPYRDSLVTQYRLTDEAQREVDAYFVRLEQMAAKCPDQTTFINLFMQDPMYQEYLSFFTKYQSMCVTQSGETVDQAVSTMKKENAKSTAREHVKSMASIEANAAISHMLPDEVNRLRWGGARTLPVIGPIIQWIDNIKWIKRMFGRND